MRLWTLLCGIGLAGGLHAQPPDVDEWSRGLDFDLPEPPASPATAPEVPATQLFADWEALPALPVPEHLAASNGLIRLTLPAGRCLVAPNPARLDEAYRQMAATLATRDLQPAFPLRVVLHADGNFSVAVALGAPPEGGLPAGLDLSPLPETELAGIVADIQLIDKTHPLVLRAYRELRDRAGAQGWRLDRRELIFLPLAPGQVFFAMRILPEKSAEPR